MSDLREQLAEAVPHADWCHEADRHVDFPCACQGYRDDIADALAPVVAPLQQRATDAEAALQRVRELHVPYYEINGRRVDNLVTVGCDQHNCAGDNETPCPEAAEDGYHEVPGCAECRYVSEWDVEGYLLWPCPTIRALDAQ